MKTLALLAGLTIAALLTGMVVAGRTAGETSIVLPDQEGTCAECATRQPIKVSDIPQGPRDRACNDCATQQSNEPNIIPESLDGAPAPSTEEMADSGGKCTDCTPEPSDGPLITTTVAPPPVKLTEHAAGCADCAIEESRRRAPLRQSGGLKQRPTQQAHSFAATPNRHAAHRGQRQQSRSAGDCPFSAEIKRVLSLM
jgi:hypothetical protein